MSIMGPKSKRKRICTWCKKRYIRTNSLYRYCSTDCRDNKKSYVYNKRRAMIRKEDAWCNQCGNPREDPRFKNCYDCRLYHREFQKNRKS